MSILIMVVFLTLFISANCSLYEAVLYSTRMGTLESVKTKEKKPKLASIFISMKKNISEPLAAILILNTIANTAGATIAGMYAPDVFGSSIVPVFSVLLTLAILFFSEIIPKTFGAVLCRAIWPYIVYPLKVMKTILSPIIYLTQKVTSQLTHKQKIETITEDEILALVHLGAHEGEISHEESKMVRNIINLENKKTSDIMTPRTMIFSLDEKLSVSEAFKIAHGKGATRIPVYKGEKEKIIGYVMMQDLSVSQNLEKAQVSIKNIIRPISFFTEETNCLTILTNFLKHRKHIAIVSDEFGGVAGLVTLEDLIETILGTEIVDETDKIVDLQDAARKRKPGNQKTE
jgi:CBS domain containing-hemolysin-like protein